MLRMMKKETLYQRVFVDFNIDMIDVDEDFIEKEVLEEASDDISMLLTDVHMMTKYFLELTKKLN